MSSQDARPFTIKKITKTTDKFAAICYIYEGQFFQELCREQNPDGTYNLSEKCLAQLPYHSPYFNDADLPNVNNSATNGSSESSSITPYRGQANALALYDPGQSAMPPFRTFLVHYWPAVLLSIIGTFLLAMFLANYIMPRRHRRRNQATVDEYGNVIIGKIKFHPDKELGHGSKGTFVFKGFFENTQECAIKRIVAKTLTLADREINFLRSLQHVNLVRYLATEKDPGFVYIAIELAECTLKYLVEERKFEEFSISKEEVCKQSAFGLQYLHKQNIVHRDIKPDNILVSLPKPPDNQRVIMISDFGLSKQLTSKETFHSSMRYFDGTQGWMPPEIIMAQEKVKTLSPSKSADIFSLGCVFYYVVFDGNHPFGDFNTNECRENIKADRNLIDHFSELNKSKEDNSTSSINPELRYMANDLVSAMIVHEASKRPPINSILKYPLFWSKKQSLQFLSEVSDRIENKSFDSLARRIEGGKRQVFGFDWKIHVSEALLKDMNDKTSRRTYKERSMQDLLRLIRNKNNHYNDCSPALKLELGNTPDEFYSYFSSRFPRLIVFIYKAMQELKKEAKFMEYYEQGEDYAFPLPQQPNYDSSQNWNTTKREKATRTLNGQPNDQCDIVTNLVGN